MAIILCKYSGIEFRTEHFSIYNSHGESHHPIFDVPLKKLWKYFPKWQEGSLTKTDSFLLFVAYLKATDLVEFRTHVWQRPDTDRIVSSNMESLFYTIGRIITIKHPRFSIPQFVISGETRDLSNVSYWIRIWDECYQDFMRGLKDQELSSILKRKEIALERLIKNPSLKPERYAHILADWASHAGSFPEFTFTDSNGNETTLSDYWQSIIIKCYTALEIITIPEKDLTELIEHCEESIDTGSIQAHHLFTTLREGLSTLQGFFSLGNVGFKILGADDSVESANIQLLIDSAPVAEPRRIDYPTEFAFLKAKMKWNLASRNGSQNQLKEGEL